MRLPGWELRRGRDAAADAKPDAKPDADPGMPGPKRPMHYDPATVEKLHGKVAEIVRGPMDGGRGGGVHLQLETGKETIAVHVGPSWYLDEKGVKIEKGATIDVTGSRTTIGDQTAVVAREVTVNGKTVVLRDEQGLPKWRGGGAGGPRRGPS